MASDLEIKANEAYIDDHFELAVKLYFQAIEQNPTLFEFFSFFSLLGTEKKLWVFIDLLTVFFFFWLLRKREEKKIEDVGGK